MTIYLMLRQLINYLLRLALALALEIFVQKSVAHLGHFESRDGKRNEVAPQ